MGLMGRLKERASEFSTEAKKAGSQAQSKVAEATAKRKADAAAQKLGYLIYREKTQGTPAGSEVEVLVEEITSLQRSEPHVAEAGDGSEGSGAPQRVTVEEPAQPQEPSLSTNAPGAPTQSEPAER